MLVYNGARWVHICEICAVKPVHNVYENNTYFVLVANVRSSRYLPVHCAKGAEFASFAVHFWSSLLMVRDLKLVN